MINDSSRLWELVQCPVTGLPITTKPGWTDLNFGKDYRLTLIMLGDNILYSRPSEYATLHDVKNALMIIDKVVTKEIPEGHPYVHIEDYSNLHGASIEARKYFIDYMKKRERLLGLIFCGTSSMFKMSIKLGKRLNIVNFDVQIVNDYSDAVKLACKLLSSENIREDRPIDTFTEECKVSDVMSLLITSKPDWSLQLDGFSVRFEVIGNEIFHADANGYLEERHIAPIFRMQEKVMHSINTSEYSYYFVGGVKEVKGSRKARRLYFEYIMKWYKKYPFKMYIFYGASRLLHAAINLTIPLALFDVRVVKDLNSALVLISKEKSKDTGLEPLASDQTQRYVDELLHFLGSINWESDSFDTDVPVDPSHPFSPVFDAIALIKNDIDDLYRERKQAEDEIKESLKEKEVLLKEIHHRVKNNLQIICSLLSLQAKQIKDKQARDMFEDSRNRIRSMALIHEELYRSKDFAKIDFTGYIRNLTKRLIHVYSMDPSRLELKLKVEKVFLGIDLAVPCSIVINELVNNTLKHAFPPSFNGKMKIEIELHPVEVNEIELIVRDNGVGIPEDWDLRKTESLGMQLIHILVEDQLNGKIVLDRRGGTKFIIRIEAE